MGTPERYTASTTLPVSAKEAFQYHERPGALQRLIPPWEHVDIEHSDNSLTEGSRVVLRNKIFGIPVRWIAEHTDYDPPNLFADTQVSGPFKQWDHRHVFQDNGSASTLRDEITYKLPGGFLGKALGSGKASRTIESMFAYRHRVTREDLELLAKYPTAPLKVAISGSSGLVGDRVRSLLTLLGHQVRPIVRSEANSDDEIAIWSDPTEAQKFNDVDVVVHLAGKSIADKRWTDSVKKEIRESRVEKTRELCERLAVLKNKPSVLICASATGIYGDRGEEVLVEDSASGDDFLAEVAQQWEAACQPAVDAGIRVVNARFGIILSRQGGALTKMLLPAKFGGGSLGSGKQWWSWIGLDDVVGGIYHAMQTDTLRGPVNFVAPEPIQNKDFARTLANVLGRPALVPAPAFALRLALGEMADALLLASTRVNPTRLIESGYEFRFTDLADALGYELGIHRLESIE